jgi:pyruvate dehydrogenase E2 component (dihydrolipoamide acetyltransferase)
MARRSISSLEGSKKMDVKVPSLAENINSGTIVKIFVVEGEQVQKDQDIVELETEKAVAAIPSPVDGKVTKLHVKEGEEVQVGQVLLSLSEVPAKEEAAKGKKEEGAEKSESERETEKARAEPLSADGKNEGAAGSEEESEEPQEEKRSKADLAKASYGPPASPTVRKLALQLGIDLSRVRGSERGGRITLDDVRMYIEQLQKIDSKRTDKIPKRERTIDFARWGYIHKQPMSSLRKKISEAMVTSWTSVPHVTQFHEADISSPTKFIEEYASQYEKKGTRLTLTSLVMKALVPILKKYPTFNCSLDEVTEEIILKEYFHFGVAVDTEQGLIVPVIRDVDKKRLVELSKELGELAEKARQRRVSLEELQGGTFTISNQGGIGGGHFTPIIHTPEVAVLGLGRAEIKPVVRNGKIEEGMLLPLCLSYDHRVIDGANAARFVRDLAEELGNFKEEQVKLEAKETPQNKETSEKRSRQDRKTKK